MVLCFLDIELRTRNDTGFLVSVSCARIRRRLCYGPQNGCTVAVRPTKKTLIGIHKVASDVHPSANLWKISSCPVDHQTSQHSARSSPVLLSTSLCKITRHSTEIMSFQNYDSFQAQQGQPDAGGAGPGAPQQQDSAMGGQNPDNSPAGFQGGNVGEPGSTGGQPGGDAKTTLWYVKILVEVYLCRCAHHVRYLDVTLFTMSYSCKCPLDH